MIDNARLGGMESVVGFSPNASELSELLRVYRLYVQCAPFHVSQCDPSRRIDPGAKIAELEKEIARLLTAGAEKHRQCEALRLELQTPGYNERMLQARVDDMTRNYMDALAAKDNDITGLRNMLAGARAALGLPK